MKRLKRKQYQKRKPARPGLEALRGRDDITAGAVLGVIGLCTLFVCKLDRVLETLVLWEFHSLVWACLLALRC